MPKCERYESKKKYIDGVWLNPNRYKMDNQHPSPEQGKDQRLSRKGVGHKRLMPEVVYILFYFNKNILKRSGLLLKPNQLVEMHWHPKNIKYYTNLGYKYTKTKEKFMVRAEDLPPQSHAEVIVICDYCGEEYLYKYQNLVNQCSKELGDACPRCKYEKQRKSMKLKYGVENPFDVPGAKEKCTETILRKYGVNHYSQTKEYREKCKATYLSHVEEGSVEVPTSKPQIEMNETLKQMYGNALLNYPCGRCMLDSMVEVNGIKIDVEFDGIFWHKGKENADRRRNYFVISQGFKVLRIKGNHKAPTEEQLRPAIEKLVNSKEQFIEINI